MSNERARAFMAVKALAAALKAAADVLDDDLDRFVEEQGLVTPGGGPPNFRTEFGLAVSTTRQDQEKWDQAAVVRLATADYPHEVVSAWTETITVDHPATVRETLYPTLRARCTVDGDDLVDKETGEVLGRLIRGGHSYSARLTSDAKEQALDAVLNRLATLTAIVAGDPLSLTAEPSDRETDHAQAD